MNAGECLVERVFIVGCPRSGTYLLSSILQSSFNLAIPVESQFIPLFGRIIFLFGDLTKKNNVSRLLKCIYVFLKVWTKVASRGRNYALESSYSLLITERFAGEIIVGVSSYSELIDAIFRIYAREMKAVGWGDKMAFRHPVDLRRLQDIFPNARIIHIVRDARDVGLSWRKIWTGPRTLNAAAIYWNNCVGRYEAWGKMHPQNFLTVRYEDLLNNPPAAIERIGDFIGIIPLTQTFNGSDSGFAQALANGNTHQNLAHGIDQTNQKKWRTQLSGRYLAEYCQLAGPQLVTLGYESCHENYSAFAKVKRAFLKKIAQLREMFSVINLLYRMKFLIPIVLGLFIFFLSPKASKVLVLKSNLFGNKYLDK